MMDERELRNIVEAALFVADAPLTIDKLLSLFPDAARPSREQVKQALDGLVREYDTRGVELRRIQGAYRFQSRAAYREVLGKLWAGRAPRYSRALLETLAIIAYRQPVTRGDIEEIRGVGVSTEIIKTLLGRQWIHQVGHRDVPGRPVLLATTRGFLEHFGLNALADLPSLSELRDTDTIARELNLSLDLEPPQQAVADETEDTESEVRDTAAVAANHE